MILWQGDYITDNVVVSESSVLDRFILKSRDLTVVKDGVVCTRVGDGCIRISNCSCNTESGDPSGC